MTQRTAAALILVVALALRVGFVLATPDYRPLHDDRDFDRIACAIVNTGDFPLAPSTRPTATSCGDVGLNGGNLAVAYRAPGLPYLLAGTYIATSPLTDDRVLAARLMLALLGAIVVLLVGMVTARIWNGRAALAAMGLTAVFPPLIIVGGSLLSEIPFTALSLGAVLLVIKHLERKPGSWRSWWLAGAGLAAGLAWLVRGNGVLLIAILAIAVWARPAIRPRSALPAVTLAAVACLTVAPWTIRNAVQLGHFVPIYMSNAALAGNFNEDAWNDPVRPGAWRMPSRTESLGPLVKEKAGDRHELDQAFLTAAIDFVRDHPESPFVNAFHNTRRLFMAGSGGPSWNGFSVAMASQDARFADITKISMWLLGILALCGLFARAAWRAPWWFWPIPLSSLLVAALLCSEIRYAVPFMPWMALLGGIALTEALGAPARARRSSQPYPGAAGR